MKHIIQLVILCTFTLYLTSCANIGQPPGGPKDETPPILVKSNPPLNSRNFNGENVKLYFDENIQLKNLLDNFIISPPLEEQANARAYGKEIRVDLNNELQENTTYTVYFGNSVMDNNESNILENFSFAFSTGEDLDSMMVSGIVLDAQSLNPVKDIIVGIYADMSDSAFIKNVPIRIAKTDIEGEFSIRNVPYGKYKIYALKDANSDYRYNQPGEQIAFTDSIISPSLDTVMVTDTLFTDSATVDTIVEKSVIWYYPDSIILMAFNKERKFQNLKKKERKEPYKLSFVFASSIDTIPKLEMLDTFINEEWFIPEFSVTRDTLYYWLLDSMLYKRDSLKVSFRYQKTDTANVMIWQTDTLDLTYRKKEKKKGRRRSNEDEAPKPNPKLSFKDNIGTSMEYGSTAKIVFDEPIAKIDFEQIRLFKVVDTVETQIPFDIEQDTTYFRRYYIRKRWDPELDYRLEWDSACIENIYGIVTDKFKRDIKVKGLDQYSEIYITLKNAPQSGYVQILNSRDEVVKSLDFTRKDNVVEFKLLPPGTYFAKLVVDKDNDSEWTTGDFLQHIQPESVYYFHKRMEVKANWTIEEEWDILAKPIYKQKHSDIKGLEKK